MAAAQELQLATRDLNIEANNWTPLVNAANGGPPAGPEGPALALDALAKELKRLLSGGSHSPTPLGQRPVEKGSVAA